MPAAPSALETNCDLDATFADILAFVNGDTAPPAGAGMPDRAVHHSRLVDVVKGTASSDADAKLPWLEEDLAAPTPFSPSSSPEHALSPGEEAALAALDDWPAVGSIGSGELRGGAHGSALTGLRTDTAGKNAASSGSTDRAQPLAAAAFGASTPILTPVVVSSFYSLSRTASTYRTSRSRFIRAANQNTSSWKRMTSAEKLQHAMVLSGVFDGVGWSLNLPPKKAKQIEEAAANGNDFLRGFTNHLERHLRKRLGYVPLFTLMLEFSPAGGLHLHGTAVLNDLSDAHQSVFKQALRAAAGKIPGRAGATQAHATPLFDGAGWFRYCVKDIDTTQARLDSSKVFFINHAMRRLAKEAFEASQSRFSARRLKPKPKRSSAVRINGHVQQRHQTSWLRLPTTIAAAPLLDRPLSGWDRGVSALGLSSALFVPPAVPTRLAVQPTHNPQPHRTPVRRALLQRHGKGRGRGPPDDPALHQQHAHPADRTERHQMHNTDTANYLPDAIVAHLVSRRSNGKFRYVYDVVHEGELIVTASRNPACDMARALLAKGIKGTAYLHDWHTNVCRMIVNIQGAAKWSVVEEDARGLRLARYRPFPADRTNSAPDVEDRLLPVPDNDDTSAKDNHLRAA